MKEPMIHQHTVSITLYDDKGNQRSTAYPLKCRCQQCHFNYDGSYCLTFSKSTQPYDTCMHGLKMNLQ